MKFNKDKINLNLLNNNSVVPKQSRIAKVDSETSRHCFSTTTKKILNNIGFPPDITSILTNNKKIQAHATAHIPIKESSRNATKKYVLIFCINMNLISRGQLHDDGCYVLLTKKKFTYARTKIYIYKDIETTQMNSKILLSFKKC